MEISDKSKLLLIPSGYNTGKVYSVFPTDGDGDFTFSRTGEATRINPGGLIETVETQIPRIDHSGGGCPSLLLEPQRTNSVLNSEPTANEGDTIGITYELYSWENGLSNAVRFTNGVTSFRYCGTAIASVSNTFSFYVLMNDEGEPLVGDNSSQYDLSVAIGGLVVSDVSTEYQGNNIWRVFGTSTVGLSTLLYNGVIKYDVQSDRGFICTGFQIEQGSYATSYIPTNGATATRVGELCNNAGNVNTFNDNEGVLFVEGKFPNTSASANRYITISDGGGSPYTNQISLYFFDSTRIFAYIGGISSATQAFRVDNVDIQNSVFKIAIQYKNGDNKLFFNGVEYFQQGTFVDSNLSGLNNLDLASADAVAFSANMKIKDLRYYDTVLTDAELQELTTL